MILIQRNYSDHDSIVGSVLCESEKLLYITHWDDDEVFDGYSLLKWKDIFFKIDLCELPPYKGHRPSLNISSWLCAMHGIRKYSNAIEVYVEVVNPNVMYVLYEPEIKDNWLIGGSLESDGRIMGKKYINLKDVTRVSFLTKYLCSLSTEVEYVKY
jgi:hypothetical protein